MVYRRRWPVATHQIGKKWRRKNTLHIFRFHCAKIKNTEKKAKQWKLIKNQLAAFAVSAWCDDECREICRYSCFFLANLWDDFLDYFLFVIHTYYSGFTADIVIVFCCEELAGSRQTRLRWSWLIQKLFLLQTAHRMELTISSLTTFFSFFLLLFLLFFRSHTNTHFALH